MKRWPWAAALAVAGACLLVWLSWFKGAPRPPLFDLTGLDDNLVLVVREAEARVAKDPGSGELWGRLGMLLMAHGLWAESMECLAQAEKLAPNEPAWPYLRANYLLHDHPEEGVALIRRALAVSSSAEDQALFRIRLAEIHIGLGRLVVAGEELAALPPPDIPRVAYARAALAAAEGRWADARGMFERLLKEPQAEQLTRRQLAALCRRAGDTDTAKLHEARARELPDPPPWHDPYLRAMRALRVDHIARVVHAQHGSADQAVAALRTHPRKDGRETFILWLEASRKLIEENRAEEAEPILREALIHFPDSPRLLLLLGGLRERAGTRPDWEEALSLAGRAGPGPKASMMAGRALFALGRDAEAAERFRAAADATPGDPAAHLGLGRCLARMDKRVEALEALKRAVQVAGNDPEPARELAAWQMKWGER